jgi:hypothetical protein
MTQNQEDMIIKIKTAKSNKSTKAAFGVKQINEHEI